MKKTWLSEYDKNPAESIEMLKSTAQADILLLHAVDMVGIDWCIERLRFAKRKNCQIESVLDIILSAGKRSTSVPPR